MNFLEKNWFPVLVLVLVGYATFFAGTGGPSVGGVTNLDSLTLSDTLTTATMSVSGNTTVTGNVTVGGELLGSLFTQGGATTSSSTTAVSFTLTAANVCDNAVYEMTPSIGAITVTFPTAAQLVADCIPNIGDSRTIWMHNASTTGGAITFADGSGGIHLEGEGLTTVMDFTEWAEITMLNVDGARYVLDVEIRQDAD